MFRWLKQLIHGSQSDRANLQAGGHASTSLDATVQAHLQRLAGSMADPRMDKILGEVYAGFYEHAAAIEAMVQETRSDGKLHTKEIGYGNASTWLVVSSLPSERLRSAAFFEAEYPPGYLGYLNFWLNSPAAKIAAIMGHSVMAHLHVYADRGVGLGLFSLDIDKPLEACSKWILPEESMSAQDKRTIGL